MNAPMPYSTGRALHRPRFGIGARLGLAFALSAALAVVACIVGWLSYERMSGALVTIEREHLPASSAAARLAEQGGAIIAAAPQIGQAATAQQVQTLSLDLDARLASMRRILAESPSPQATDARVIVDRLGENLTAIAGNTLNRLVLAARSRDLVAQVRSLHADLVEEAEPLVEDARFTIGTTLESVERRRVDATAVLPDLREQQRRTETILQLAAQANLTVGLLTRTANVATAEELTQDIYFLSESADLLKTYLAPLGSLDDALTLRQVIQRLIELATGPDGLPALRRRELDEQAAGSRLLEANRSLVASLDREIADHVEKASAGAVEAAANAANAIALGRNLLIAIALAAVIAAAAIALAYVQSSLLGRIRSLAQAARDLASGQTSEPIPVTGADELTDMARAMERFRKTQDELVQAGKLAALGELSAGIAHELNQPLTAIRSHAHNGLLLLARGEAAGVARAFEKVQSLTDRAGQVVSHLRRFARRSGSGVEPVVLASVVEGAAMLLASRLKDSGAILSVEIDRSLRVLADEIRLEQVIVNLIANAADAVKGREQRRVAVSASTRDGRVTLSVADTGPGIDPAVAETLFDPFVTTKPIGEGLGLGLSISYNIIRDFGGRLMLGPNAPGANFLVDLPAAPEASS